MSKPALFSRTGLGSARGALESAHAQTERCTLIASAIMRRMTLVLSPPLGSAENPGHFGWLWLIGWIAAALCTGCGVGESAPLSKVGTGGAENGVGHHEGDRPALARGINLGNALDAPSEGEWGVVLSDDHFRLAKEAGLDHVRLPVRFSAHTGPAPEYLVDETFFARVDWAIERALSMDLSILLDVHHFEEIHTDPDGEKARLLAIWRQLAERYRDAPETVFFEILNEPSQALDAAWNQIFLDTLGVIRETNPERWVIIDGPHWADPDKISGLRLPNDPRIIASFHFYKPLPFSVQGAPWMGAEYQTTGVIFPGPPLEPLVPTPDAQAVGWVAQFFRDYNERSGAQNPASEASVRAYFDAARRFAETNQVPIHLGEFAVVDFADAESRTRWLRSVVTIAEEHQIPWTYWDDGGHNRGMIVENDAWVSEVQDGLFGVNGP